MVRQINKCLLTSLFALVAVPEAGREYTLVIPSAASDQQCWWFLSPSQPQHKDHEHCELSFHSSVLPQQLLPISLSIHGGRVYNNSFKLLHSKTCSITHSLGTHVQDAQHALQNISLLKLFLLEYFHCCLGLRKLFNTKISQFTVSSLHGTLGTKSTHLVRCMDSQWVDSSHELN